MQPIPPLAPRPKRTVTLGACVACECSFAFWCAALFSYDDGRSNHHGMTDIRVGMQSRNDGLTGYRSQAQVESRLLTYINFSGLTIVV